MLDDLRHAEGLTVLGALASECSDDEVAETFAARGTHALTARTLHHSSDGHGENNGRASMKKMVAALRCVNVVKRLARCDGSGRLARQASTPVYPNLQLPSPHA